MRKLHKGMGEAVAKRTILRPGEDRTTLRDVGPRVALGNSLLHPTGERDREVLCHLIQQGVTLMSGRHLQHGDETQPTRAMELFTNCSHAGLSHLQFWLLLNGSGVGRCYDDALIDPVARWDQMPNVLVALSKKHPDYKPHLTSWESVATLVDLTLQGAEDLDGLHQQLMQLEVEPTKATFVFHVPDSREGWAKALELLEYMAYLGVWADCTVILDFSPVREKGAPIKGMQNRPAAGPIPTMDAFIALQGIKSTKWAPWKMAMHVDHHMAACVAMGGARRAARIALKYWKDPGIFEFIIIKQQGELWSANNSVACDDEFYLAMMDKEHAWHQHAMLVMAHIGAASYAGNVELGGAGAGEPGIVNVGKLVANNEGLHEYRDGEFLGTEHYPVADGTKRMLAYLVELVLAHPYQYGINPCGEIALFLLGAYCVIGDAVLYHAKDAAERELVMRVMVRALIRANLMSALYKTEVSRTNRIGIGLTALHEFAWKVYGLTWHDLTNPDITKSLPFWLELSRLARIVDEECELYCAEIGVALPHTRRTIKPSGSVSKLFGLTEGAHLPSMLFYLRWVQFSIGDPIVDEYRAMGYPVKESLETYAGMCCVGFPTRLHLTEIMPTELIVTAAQATLESQYTWVERLEHYWLRGVEEDGVTERPDYGNQVSYTAKYDRDVISFEEFTLTLAINQKRVRCMSVMPNGDLSGYEYLPEEAVSPERYAAIVMAITDNDLEQDIDLDSLKCQSGACPI
jgi:adenosylcobalamin-dependent ribonucleoside-triphosphate reductase